MEIFGLGGRVLLDDTTSPEVLSKSIGVSPESIQAESDPISDTVFVAVGSVAIASWSEVSE